MRRILVLVEPRVSLSARLFEDVVLRLLHEVDDLLGGFRELVVTNSFRNVRTVVHVGHHVVEGSPVARYCVLFAVVKRTEPFRLRESIVQVRILFNQVMDRDDRAHTRDGGEVLDVLHDVQQLELLSGRQHEVQLLRVGIPRDTRHGNLDVHAVLLQLLIDRCDTGLVVGRKHARLHDAHRMDRIVAFLRVLAGCAVIGRSLARRTAVRGRVFSRTAVAGGERRHHEGQRQKESKQLLRFLHCLLHSLNDFVFD